MRRSVSVFLVFALLCSTLQCGAFAEAYSTEDLLMGVLEYLFSDDCAGIEVGIEHNGIQDTFCYLPNEGEGPLFSLDTSDATIWLDDEGVYSEKDSTVSGLKYDDMIGYLCYQLAGIETVPDFSNEDGEMFVNIFKELLHLAVQDGVKYDVNMGEDASISIRIEIEADKFGKSADAAARTLISERETDINALLSEYGELLNICINGFPQNTEELTGVLDALGLASLETGATIDLTFEQYGPNWQITGEVFGWNVELKWDEEGFSAVLSPGDTLPDALPVYALDTRDFEQLLLIVHGLIQDIPEEALAVAYDRNWYGRLSFHIDTLCLKEYFEEDAQVYLAVHEPEISALFKKYMPFLELIAPQAKEWKDIDLIKGALLAAAEMLPSLRLDVQLALPSYNSFYSDDWQLSILYDNYWDNYCLTASGDSESISAMMSSGYWHDRHTVYYTFDAYRTHQGYEILYEKNTSIDIWNLTVSLTEEEGGYFAEVYTSDESFSASGKYEGDSAELEFLWRGGKGAEGTIKKAGDCIYIDVRSDEFFLDGSLRIGDGKYTLSLLVNRLPVTAVVEIAYGIKMKLHIGSFDVTAEYGWNGLRLYLEDSRRRTVFTRSLCIEFQPKESIYSIIETICYRAEDEEQYKDYHTNEYGFSYVPGQLKIMNGYQLHRTGRSLHGR